MRTCVRLTSPSSGKRRSVSLSHTGQPSLSVPTSRWAGRSCLPSRTLADKRLIARRSKGRRRTHSCQSRLPLRTYAKSRQGAPMSAMGRERTSGMSACLLKARSDNRPLGGPTTLCHHQLAGGQPDVCARCILRGRQSALRRYRVGCQRRASQRSPAQSSVCYCRADFGGSRRDLGNNDRLGSSELRSDCPR